MDCAEAKLQIEPYVTGEIPPDAKSALEEHLGACAECRLDVELTRASRNTPPDPAPETPPALVEPIDPGGAEAPGTPVEPRAAGEASSTAAPATAPGGESWTLDSIFGSGGSTKGSAVPPVFESPGAGTSSADAPAAPIADVPAAPIAASAQSTPFEESRVSEPPKNVSPKKSLGLDVKPGAGSPVRPAPPAEPEPPRRPASTPVFATSADEALPPLLTPAPRKKSDEPPPSDAPSWDFEPAEANGKAKPPEGSLFFAKEALSRGTPPKKGSPAARLALWAGGSVLGVGLLAASIWIALSMHSPLPSAVRGTERAQGVAQGGEPGTPAVSPAAPVDSTATAGVGAGAASAPPPSAPAAPSAVSPPAAPPAQAAPVASPTPPSTTGPGTARESAARTATPAPTANEEAPAHVRAAAKAPVAKTGTNTGHGRHGTAITKTMSKSEALARADTSARNGTHARTSKAGGEASARTPAPRADSRTTTAPAVPKATESGSAPPAETSRPAESAPSTETTAPESGKTTPDAAPPKAAAPAPDPANAPDEPPPQDAGAQRPIDRLHLATLAAEQSADLPGLRKMRDTWRGFVRTSLGPDRARAKRELADCLWAIQTLTSRTSDQKEALAAYRDYVLNAPAGGADARTVARMRQLEDALTESH